MRFRISIVALLVCLSALAATLAAQGNCSLQTVQGTYVITGNGFFGTMPYVGLGTVKVAANGTTQVKITIVLPSGPMELTSSGELTVSPDCRATVKYPDFKEEALILRNGEEIRTLLVDPVVIDLPPYGKLPRVQTATGYRLSPGANAEPKCSPAMAAGVYSQHCTGYMPVMVGPTPTFLPVGFIATISLDGKGAFSGGGTFVTGGNKLSMVYKNGVYSLGSDCRGTASFEFEGLPGVWTEKTVLFNQGKDFISVTTSGQEVDMCRFTRMEH